VWTPQDKWQQRTGWRRVPLGVRGREVRVLVRVEGPCRRVGWDAWLKSGFGLGEKPCWGLDGGERSVAWSAWVYGALLWSGYCGWGGWTGGARWGGCRGRARWTFRDVLWRVRCEVLGGEINGGFWGRGGCGDEALKNRGVGWCWGVDVVLSWLCAFRL